MENYSAKLQTHSNKNEISVELVIYVHKELVETKYTRKKNRKKKGKNHIRTFYRIGKIGKRRK